ncbi:MAG: universal stress protein, partial [Pseudomonadota bacterium]
MTLRKILVPIRGDGRGEAVLSYAAALARRHSAHLQAVHCRARPADFIPIGVNVPRAFRAQIEAQGETLAREEGAALREKFLALLPGLGIEPTEEATAPTDRATGSWTEAAGKMADVIRIYGRLADLVAVAKPDRDANLGVNSLRAAIYQTARPVLMCPPEAAPADFGRRVAIAWNGSLEATRAVALNLPVLRMAEEVV